MMFCLTLSSSFISRNTCKIMIIINDTNINYIVYVYDSKIRKYTVECK
jgi:hypothetical protein